MHENEKKLLDSINDLLDKNLSQELTTKCIEIVFDQYKDTQRSCEDRIKDYNDFMKELDSHCTYWQENTSLKHKVKIKLFNLFNSLADFFDPFKDFHDKLVDDVNTLMGGDCKSVGMSPIGKIDLDTIDSYQKEELRQLGREMHKEDDKNDL